MSADNYYFVREREDGKFDVTHRYASVYYADEMAPGEYPMEGHGFNGDADGWTIPGDSRNVGRVFATLEEAEEAATRRPDWIEYAPLPADEDFETLEEAVLFAHRCVANASVVEYGVIVQDGLL